MNRTSSIPRPALAVLSLVLLALSPAALTFAQHALDANPRIGAQGLRVGYNAPNRLQGIRYAPGSSRSLYTVSRTGSLHYNPNNAFAPRARYDPTGYHGIQRSSPQYSRRFRYTGYGHR